MNKVGYYGMSLRGQIRNFKNSSGTEEMVHWARHLPDTPLT